MSAHSAEVPDSQHDRNERNDCVTTTASNGVGELPMSLNPASIAESEHARSSVVGLAAMSTASPVSA